MRTVRFLLIALLALLAVPVAAQTTTEVDVVNDVLIPRLEEYNEALPEGYGVIAVEAFEALLAEDPETVILDVREPQEIVDFGIIEGAVHIPMRTIGENLNLLPDLDANIVVVCKGGFRASIAMTSLQILGYTDVKVLKGGFDAWVGAELPVVEEAAVVEAGEVPEAIDPDLLTYVGEYLTNLPQGWGAVKATDLFEEMFETIPDLLLDVRSDTEWAEGYIEGATHIPVDDFFARLDEIEVAEDANIVVYCAGSYRGGIVATQLGLLGFTNVRNLSGGINSWKAAELPIVTGS